MIGWLKPGIETCEMTGLETILARLTGKQSRFQSLQPFPKPFADSLEHKLRIELTHASNAIEGNTLTLRETQMLIDEGVTPSTSRTLRELHEAVNHNQAVLMLYRLAEKPGHVGERDLLDLHALVLRNIHEQWAGRYRNNRVFVVGSPLIPPGPQHVPRLMEELAAWLGNLEGHPVTSATEAHYRFVKIHPFVDGNGRTSRLLMNLMLLRAGYPLTVIPADQRAAYIGALDEADRGVSEPFHQLIAECVERSLDLYLSVHDP